jgi:hypothetical protein
MGHYVVIECILSLCFNALPERELSKIKQLYAFPNKTLEIYEIPWYCMEFVSCVIVLQNKNTSNKMNSRHENKRFIAG